MWGIAITLRRSVAKNAWARLRAVNEMTAHREEGTGTDEHIVYRVPARILTVAVFSGMFGSKFPCFCAFFLMRLETSGVTLLKESIAFFVELVDPSASAGGDDANGENVQVSDPRKLYQGVFWQVSDRFRSLESYQGATKRWQWKLQM